MCLPARPTVCQTEQPLSSSPAVPWNIMLSKKKKKKIRIVLFLANRRGSGTLKVFPLKLALSQPEMIVCVIDSVCDI